MKKCKKCNIEKDLKSFNKHPSNKDGLQGICKKCYAESVDIKRKTKDGLITQIYGAQRHRCIKRGHPMPFYTKKEFHDWVYSNKKFNKLYEKWVSSGYNKMKKPSIDRINNNKTYSFDNINLTTWENNYNNSLKDRGKSVVQMDKYGKVVKIYKNINQAVGSTGVCKSSIYRSCMGIYKSSGGYYWEYK